jgi:hypothetical protein
VHRTLVSICALLGVLACVVTVGCGTSASSTIGVSIMSPASAQTIDQGQTVSVAASVSSSNDSTINQSVTWSISGSGCTGAACGSLTNQTATSVTYNAPSSVLSNTVVSVIATSVENPSKSASIQITVVAIAVQIQNKVSELAAGTGNFFNTQFVALVQNDPTGAGVTWTLTANGAQCSPACGTLTVNGPQSVSVTYTPPASVPAAPANMPTLTATSVTNPSKSDTDAFTILNGAAACGTGGNESELNGEYAIMLQGWSGTGAGSPFLFGASFGADGAGHITGGADQFNPFFNHSESGAGVIPSASSYSVSSDNRGCLTLTDQNEVTYTFQFSLGGITAGIASKGDIIYFNQQSATPQRGSGILRKQDTTAFSLSALAPNYALGVDGWANASSSSTVLVHYAAAGSFTQSGGTLSNPAFDANDGGSMTNEQGLTNFGTIQGPISTGTGATYATISLPGPSGGEADVTVYVINSSELFFISNDLSETGIGALFCGRAIATPSSFTAASISPNYIFRFTGNSSSSAAATIGLASFSGGAEGNVSGVFDQFAGGTATNQNISGTYGFTTISGRLEINGGSTAASPICYLTNPVDNISALCISTDTSASGGVLDTQPASTYSDTSLAGNFFFGMNEPGDNTVPDLSGVASISAGSLTGTQDQASSAGLSLGSAVSATMSISANGTGNLGANTVAVMNGTTLYFINQASGAPAVVQVFEQ